MLLSLDLGTTHSKAGLFNRNGELVNLALHPTATHQDSSGRAYYDPGELWSAAVEIIREISDGINPKEITAVGIASMAETGLLVDKKSAEPRSYMFPWYDASALTRVKELEHDRDPIRQFIRSGIRPNFKCSLAKLLWIRDTHPQWLEGSTWLSTADYIALRLTGEIATDFSLAGRTYAFRIDRLSWDQDWLVTLGLPADVFPPALPSGQPIGQVSAAAASLTGLSPGTPVAICGHDHVCGAFALVGTESGQVLDSMGTAEALIGSFDRDQLGTKEFRSGLVFGRHVAGGGYYWMGGMSTSGGSLDWLRRILAEPQLSYEELDRLLEDLPPAPTGIIFLPYLAGSGSPHTDIHIRGALIGLDQSHNRSDLVKAVLEGTAFESEFIRQAVSQILKIDISSLAASGGGTQIRQWMQIKADVSGCGITVPEIRESTLLGAALLAGIGCGVYSDEMDARSSLINIPASIYHPNQSQHHVYQELYQQGFLAYQKPLRESSSISSASQT
jgi:sugar (pentulose or hexulose) kinase